VLIHPSREGGKRVGGVCKEENGAVLPEHRQFYFDIDKFYFDGANVYLNIGDFYFDNANVYLDRGNVYPDDGKVNLVNHEFHFDDGEVYFDIGNFYLVFSTVRMNTGKVGLAVGCVFPVVRAGSFDVGTVCFVDAVGREVLGGFWHNPGVFGLGETEVGIVGDPVGLNRAIGGLKKQVFGVGKRGRILIER
jgi:hypothetical protein